MSALKREVGDLTPPTRNHGSGLTREDDTERSRLFNKVLKPRAIQLWATSLIFNSLMATTCLD